MRTNVRVKRTHLSANVEKGLYMSGWKQNTLFIVNQHDMLYNERKKIGMNVLPPYRGGNIFARVLREIHFQWHLPFETLWYKKAPKKYSIYILEENKITEPYIRWLRKNNEKSLIFIAYTNPITNVNMLECFKIVSDGIFSWNKIDCEKYKLNYMNGIYYPELIIKKSCPEYDVMFIGRDKGRAETVFEIREILSSLGLSMHVYLCADRMYQRFNKPYYKKLLSYEEVRNKTGKCRAILDIVQVGQTGETMRAREAMFSEIKLITNNKNIMDYDFYCPENIFVIGKDDYNDLPQFINRPFKKVDEKILNKYIETNIWEEILSARQKQWEAQ